MQTFRAEEERATDDDGQPVAGPSNYQERERTRQQRSQTILDGDRDRDITLPLPNTTPRRPHTNRTNSANTPTPSPLLSTADPSHSSLSSSSLSGSTPTTLHFPTSITSVALFPFTLFNYYLSRLGRAHDEAAKRKVRERTDRATAGWGLGEYGLREARDGEGRLREARRELKEGGLLREEREGVEPEGAEEGWVDEEVLVPAVVGRTSVEGRRASVDGGRRRSGGKKGKGKQRRAREDVGSEDSPPPVTGGWSWWGPLSESNLLYYFHLHSISLSASSPLIHPLALGRSYNLSSETRR